MQIVGMKVLKKDLAGVIVEYDRFLKKVFIQDIKTGLLATAPYATLIGFKPSDKQIKDRRVVAYDLCEVVYKDGTTHIKEISAENVYLTSNSSSRTILNHYYKSTSSVKHHNNNVTARYKKEVKSNG